MCKMILLDPTRNTTFENPLLESTGRLLFLLVTPVGHFVQNGFAE